MNRFLVIASLALLSNPLASPAYGEWFHHEDAGIEFDLPPGWTASPDGQRISIRSPDNSTAAVFWIPREKDWEAALETIVEEISEVVEDPVVEEELIEDEVNGMPLVELAGEGTVEDIEIEWSLALILADRPVIVLTFAEPDAWEGHEQDLESFLESFRRYDRAR